MPGAPPRGGGGGGGAEGDPGVYGTRRLLEVAPPTRPAPPTRAPPISTAGPASFAHPPPPELREGGEGDRIARNGQERGETEKFTRGYAVSLKP
jgi:hypothetical protein